METLTFSQALSRGVTRIPKCWHFRWCRQGWLQKPGRLVVSDPRWWFWQTSGKDSSRKIGYRLHRFWGPTRAASASRNFPGTRSKVSKLSDSLRHTICGSVWRRQLCTYYNRQQQLKQKPAICFTVCCRMRRRIVTCPKSSGHPLWRFYLARLEIPCHQHKVWLWKARLFSRSAPCRFRWLGCHC